MITEKEAELSTCFAVENGDISLPIVEHVCQRCICFDCEDMREENQKDREIYDEDGDLVDLENICEFCTYGNSRCPCDGWRCENAIEFLRDIRYDIKNCIIDPKSWFKTRLQQRREVKDIIKGLRNAINTGTYQEWDW